MLSTRNLICSTNSSSVTLWSFAEVLFDQYVVPSLLITMYFAPLILYASLISWPMLPRSKSCGMFVYRVEKSKLSKCLAFFVLLSFFSFLRTSAALSIIQEDLHLQQFAWYRSFQLQPSRRRAFYPCKRRHILVKILHVD